MRQKNHHHHQLQPPQLRIAPQNRIRMIPQRWVFRPPNSSVVTTLYMTVLLLAILPFHATTANIYDATVSSSSIATFVGRRKFPFRSILQPQQQHRKWLDVAHIDNVIVVGGESNVDTTTRIPTKRIEWPLLLLQKIRRGGASNVNEKDNVDVDTPPTSSSVQQQQKQPLLAPVTILVQTNTGSSMIDPIIELPLVNPNKRTILSIKQSIQRQLASSATCKPPLSTIQLMYQGQILTDDELLLADVLDEDDDDDDDDENENDSKSNDDAKPIHMNLDMIPPVDSKNFMYDVEAKLGDTTTADLLLAYATNEASIYYNTQQLESLRNNDKIKEEEEEEEEGDDDKENSLNSKPQKGLWITAQIRERAQQIQSDMVQTILQSSHARKLLSDTESPQQKLLNASRMMSGTSASMLDLDIRGDRVRHIGISGIRGNYIRALQHELNIEDWNKAMKHCLLFLFFGYFGGRTTLSRTILLLGAPLMILLQTRFMKLYIRQLLYTVLYNPPSIVLSLLPAPQQGILSLNMSDAMKRIYGEYIIMDELTQQILKDDPSLESNDLSKVLTSKRFTVKSSKVDVDEEEEEEEDESDGDDEDDDDDEDEEDE